MVSDDRPGLRVACFGTPEFAVPTLAALLASRHRVVGVVTQPDRPKGRGQRSHESPIKEVAVSQGIPVLQPERLKDDGFLATFASLGADIAVVAAYGKILSEAVLRVPRLGFLNVHASLLPKYRGAAPVHRAVMAGDTETGVTIMRVVLALDAGPMVGAASRPIAINETSLEVQRDLAVLGARLLVDAVDALTRGPLAETPQDETKATYAPRLEKREGEIVWRDSARNIHNKIRGLQPWPHAFTEFSGRRCLLLRSELDGLTGPQPDDAGTVVEATGDVLRVGTGLGAIRLLSLQLEGARPLTAREFIAGHRVVIGSMFGPSADRS